VPEVKLNWTTAQVEDAKLTVELEGEVPSGWSDSFETTARLLGGGDWGKVRVKKGSVRVSHVSPGSEEKLRHHLESLVAQSNAAVRPAEAEPELKGADRDSDEDTADARMAERFRAFDEDREAQPQ
jgi:hypothetical protein